MITPGADFERGANLDVTARFWGHIKARVTPLDKCVKTLITFWNGTGLTPKSRLQLRNVNRTSYSCLPNTNLESNLKPVVI